VLDMVQHWRSTSYYIVVTSAWGLTQTQALKP
jgi:hypothetical protein